MTPLIKTFSLRATVAALLVAGVIGLAMSAPLALAARGSRWHAVPIQAPANLASPDSFGNLFGNMSDRAYRPLVSAPARRQLHRLPERVTVATAEFSPLC